MKLSELNQSAYKEFYALYLNALEEVNLMDALKVGKTEMVNYINDLPKEKEQYRYAKDKWTVKEVVMHLIDTERVFQYRAFRFSRKDGVALPGFDQDDFIKNYDANERSIGSILKEYVTVRDASISLFENLSNEQLQIIGIASNIEWTVGGLGFVINGHQKHHLNILKERY